MCCKLIYSYSLLFPSGHLSLPPLYVGIIDPYESLLGEILCRVFVLFGIANFTVFSITVQTGVNICIKISIILLPERYFLKKIHLIFIHKHANDISESDLSKNHMKKTRLLPHNLFLK